MNKVTGVNFIKIILSFAFMSLILYYIYGKNPESLKRDLHLVNYNFVLLSFDAHLKSQVYNMTFTSHCICCSYSRIFLFELMLRSCVIFLHVIICYIFKNINRIYCGLLRHLNILAMK